MTDDAPAAEQDRDPEEVRFQEDPGPDRSRTYRAFRFVVEHVMLIAAAAGLLVFIVAAVLGVSLPRWLQVMGITMIVTIPFAGRPTAKKARSMLWNPNYVWIVDIDATVTKGAIYRAPAQRFREWDVLDGNLDWAAPNLAFAKNVDLEAQSLEGTWRGTLTDRELLRALQAVEECRGRLEDDAKKGFAIESQAVTIIKRATRKAVLRVSKTYERGNLPDEGDGIDDAINDAVEQFGLERDIRSENDPFEGADDAAPDDATANTTDPKENGAATAAAPEATDD